MTVDAAPPRLGVAITGIGLVTPLGRTPEEIWEQWARGRSSAAPMTRLDARTLPVRVAAEVRDFDPRKEVKNRKLLRLMIGGEDFGFKAATEAIAQAQLEQMLETNVLDHARCGVSIGCHKEGFRHQQLQDAFLASLTPDGSLDRQRFVSEGWSRVPPQVIIEALPNIGLYYIAHEFGLQGPNYNLLSVGVGGLQSLAEGMHTIAAGEADVMVAGAFDTWVNWMCIRHNHFTGILSTSTEAPETVHRPFDRTRTGSVPGEGAGMFVLESEHSARDRRASLLGRLLGAGMTCGVPSLDAEAAAESLAHCIRQALASAECEPADIDLIQLHGDATRAGDGIEARGIVTALGARAGKIPATTIKSATGLMGNASGPVEVALALEALRRGEVLPIVNLRNPEPNLGLNLVQQPQSGLDLQRALVIQRAWPNLNAALVVARG